MAIFNNSNSSTKNAGESYKEILSFWWPELVSAAATFALPIILDALIVCQLESTSTYSALGVANNFLHTITKLTEAFMVSTIAFIGVFNGAKKYKEAGKALGDAFWVTVISGFFTFLLLFLFAENIYIWLGTPEQIAKIGAPFLRLRAFGVFLAFIYASLFGFMRAVKNTKTPMQILIIGIVIFLICDYTLVLGKFGFPQMRLSGSAVSSIIQNVVMIALAFWHILRNEEYKKYFDQMFFLNFNIKGFLHILNLSWPIMIDKTILASAYVFLNKMINPMGKYAIASFTVIKDMERLAFLPAVALATVITFLVSNNLGNNNPAGARSIMRKTLYLGGAMVFVALLLMTVNARFFVHLFDHKDKFTDFAVLAFPFISLFVIFDFIQLILCGALRGAGDVKAVMVIRIIACYGFFYPLVTFISWLNIPSALVKFILIYGSFYLHTGLIGLLCIIRLKSKKLRSDKI